MCLGSRRPRKTPPLGPNFEKIDRDLSVVGRPRENLLIRVYCNGLDIDSMVGLEILRAGYPI